MNDPTMFDVPPLSPAEVVRYKGRHPVTMLPVGADEAHSCGNCANRRWIWVLGAVLPVGDTWQRVCTVIEPGESWCEQVQVGARDDAVSVLATEGSYCEDDCCNATESQAQHDRLTKGGYLPPKPWPWAGAVEEWMPACVRWEAM